MIRILLYHIDEMGAESNKNIPSLGFFCLVGGFVVLFCVGFVYLYVYGFFGGGVGG